LDHGGEKKGGLG